MAEKKEKVKITELTEDLTKFLNIFSFAERLKGELEKVSDLEGEAARLKAEIKAAEDERFLAVKHRDQMHKEIDMLKKSLEVVQADFEKAVKEEKEALENYRKQMVDQTQEIRAEHQKERAKILADTQALEFKRGNLAKQVREIESPVKSPEPGTQARIEGEVR